MEFEFYVRLFGFASKLPYHYTLLGGSGVFQNFASPTDGPTCTKSCSFATEHVSSKDISIIRHLPTYS